MRKARTTLVSSLFIAALVVALPLANFSQNREKFVISARAGGVNAVTGRASMRAHGNSEWQQLTIKENLEGGDIVRTGLDGRVELLLNPGSYMRIGENSEFELADNSPENLEVRLIRGTAIVEVTGADDTELLISITTPHTKMAIVRRGLYRVNVVPGDATELIVRKGRVMLDGSHTKVNGGNKVVFSGNSFSVAKLQKVEKDNRDNLEAWSKERAQTMARVNSKIRQRDMGLLMASLNSDWDRHFSPRFTGIWLFHPGYGCYTFVPLLLGWGSPYGLSYSTAFYGGYYCCGRYPGTDWGYPTSGSPMGSGNGPGTGTLRPPPAPTSPSPRYFPPATERKMVPTGRPSEQ